VAAATGAAAASVRALGVDAELDRLKSGSADWVLDELESAWRGRDGSELADELLQAARSRGPTEDELSSLKVPLLAIAVSDDPLHPESVARQWSALAPDAHLVVLDRASLQADRAVLGAVVRSGLDELLGPSGSP
jgi:pimeloyl-ACP methyl ester carboxylesterase